MVLDRIAESLSGPAKISGTVLASANMIPVVGVVLWDWKAFELLAVYWAEMVALGLINIPRFFLARGGGEAGWLRRAGFLVGFGLPFSLFCSVYGTLVFSLLGQREVWSAPVLALPRMMGMAWEVAGWAAPIIALSHVFSFFWNDVGRREYRSATLPGLLFAPYRRAAFLHTAVWIGACALALVGSPELPLLAFIASKTALDLGFHLYTLDPAPKAYPG